MTTKDKLLDYLHANWRRVISKGELEDLRSEFKCLAETIGRTLRRLENKGKIEVYYLNGLANYKYVKSK